MALCRRSVLSLAALAYGCGQQGGETACTECDVDADSDTDTDSDSDTDAVVCGDSAVGGTEDCDDAGESKDCDADCTFVVCGDATINKTAGEICEPTTSEPWDRCALCTVFGAGLDGTFGNDWETLDYPRTPNGFDGMQSFHYTGEPYLYDFIVRLRYDIASDTWSDIKASPPWGLGSGMAWVNGAVDSTSIYVPRKSLMYQFDLATETWTTRKETIPNGNVQTGAAVFDGSGKIWYEGPSSLVEYDPGTGKYTEHEHDKFDVYETRVAYDPWSNSILFSGFENDRFLIYGIDSGKFTESSVSPGGEIHDNTCGDNSGGVYAGSTDFLHMYRYDVATDTWEVLPDLPMQHDNDSTCVVSQDGFLYYPTTYGGFYRIGLGTIGK